MSVTGIRRRLRDLDSRFSWLSRLADRSVFWRRLASLLAHSGDSWLWLPGLAVLWWLGSGYWKERALAMGAGVLLTAVLVMTIKFSVRRSRPEGEWGRIYRSTDPHSFPSGHAARGMLLAVVALGLGPIWLGLLLLLWAPLMSLARVAMGVHYPSDVFAGWLIGAVMGGVVLLIF